MPENRSNPEPPVMTRKKAAPVLAAAAVFDAIRIFFEFFVFFGPAIAGLYCTVKVGGALTTYSLGLLGTKTAAALCIGGAIVGGAAVSGFTTPFGLIMSDAAGFTAFLVLGLWILKTNARIFKANASGALWFVGGFALSEIPFIGTIPSFTIVLWRLYGVQIKAEKAAHAKWEKENAEAQLQERNRRAAQLMQLQTAQVAEAEQEAANEALYAEAANDAQYTQEMRNAA